MRDALKRVARRPIDVVRARSGRVIHLVPESGVGFGNILYMLLAAHEARRKGRRGFATLTRTMEPWVEAFPGLGDLLIRPEDVRLFDARQHGWYQHWPVVAEPLESFVQERLFTSPLWRRHRSGPDDQVTINVRRGDYYSVPQFRALYGFNIAGYLRVALEGSLAQGPIERVRVISDDPVWCRENLTFLADYAEIIWQRPGDGPVENLLDLAASPRLILANSTFSYWGGYMSSVAHGNNHSSVWAPSFHTREWGDRVRAWQLDPRWSVVTDVPGGWDEPEGSEGDTH